MATEDEIKREMKEYIDRNGGASASWYAGIAADPRNRLFSDHGVDKDNGAWIFRTSSTADEARRVEEYLIALGCDGGGGGGDAATKAIYAYKKTPKTDP